MSADWGPTDGGPKGGGGGGSGGHKTLLYGHAVQLKHVQSEMYLACLASSTSNDKLAFDVGVQEGSEEGESSWLAFLEHLFWDDQLSTECQKFKIPEVNF
jgi:hypothetical protein